MSTLFQQLREGVKRVKSDFSPEEYVALEKIFTFDSLCKLLDELDRLTALSETHRVAAVHATQKCHELDAEIFRLVEDKSRLTARVVELEAEHKVNGLIRAWCDLHNRPIPWAKAVEIVAVIHKMPDTEKARLLSLDDPGRTGA